MKKEKKSPDIGKMYGVQIMKEAGGEDSVYCNSRKRRDEKVKKIEKGTRYRTIDKGVYSKF